MTWNRVCLVALAALGMMTACSGTRVPVVYRSQHPFSEAERRAIESVATRSVDEVRRLLPGLPATFSLFVDTGDRMIPETGETGSASIPSGVYWTVDPSHDGGVLAIVNRQLRATLFHELYHMVRESAVTSRSLRDLAIDEGLATVFERDYGAGAAPWGDYPPDVSQWATEFLALPQDADRQQWMIAHADGRRWIGYKVGTYLVERAMRVSGRPVTALAMLPTAQIIEWALE